MSEKAKYWSGVCYPENMIVNWKDDIGDLLQNAYCYCVHDADRDAEGEERKEHVHIIIAFPNTTTAKHALTLYNYLSAPGKKCCPLCQPIHNIRHMYNYLIHDTEDCRKKGKKLYNKENRVCGNNFDIGSYEQLGLEEKEVIIADLERFIIEEGITNYLTLVERVRENFDNEYSRIIRSNSGHFDRLVKGNYHRIQSNYKKELKYILKKPQNN